MDLAILSILILILKCIQPVPDKRKTRERCYLPIIIILLLSYLAFIGTNIKNNQKFGTTFAVLLFLFAGKDLINYIRDV